MIVGLTGGIGAGKTTVCNLFKQLGVPVISSDAIAHDLADTPDILQTIIDKFGTEYLDRNKKLDRHKLKHRIFTYEDDRIWLENLLHPLIKQEISKQAKPATYPYCIVEIPLLFETNMQDSVDRVLTIDTISELQIQRTTQRDTGSKYDVEAIMATQISRQKRLLGAHDVIDNTRDLDHLQQQVQNLHQRYLQLGLTQK